MTHATPAPDSLGQLRLSDAERNHALDALSSHYVEGRIDVEELDQRCGLITTARLMGELEPAFASLPGGMPFELGPDGRPRKRGSADLVPAPDDDERELEAVQKKGGLLERVDTIGLAVALPLFLLLQIVLGVPHAWIVWPVYGVLLVASRAVLGVSDADEKAYEQLKKVESKARAERLQIALERRREIEGRRD